MGTPWTMGLTRVSVVKHTAPKPVTLVVPYYENPAFFAQQLAGWASYPQDLRDNVAFIVVDDGSPTSPAADVVRQVRPELNLRVFRLEVDLRWNWIGARNRGAHEAADGWLLMTDMDHVVPADTMRAVVFGIHDPKVIYGFSRTEWTGAVLFSHPNSWLITRELFWKIGGYDETLSGHYGTDGDIRRRFAAAAQIQILNDRLVRHEHRGDSSTTRYLRKQPEDAAVKHLIAKRGADWRPRALSFPAHEVTL